MDLAYRIICIILRDKKSVTFLCFCFLGMVATSTVCNAQEPAEKRKWIGWGQAYGFYEQDDLKSVNMEGITLEYMSSHRSFKDAMVLGEALLHTRFEHHFNDDQGIYHSVKAQVIHYYYSIGFGRSLEILKSVEHDLIQIGGSVELVGGFGILEFNKTERYVSGDKVEFGQRFGTDFLLGYQLSIYVDFDNAWTVGIKSSTFRNPLYIDYDEVEGRLYHINSNMIFIGTKLGEVDCVPTRYVICK